MSGASGLARVMDPALVRQVHRAALRPDWPVLGVRALVTVREGGLSRGAWAGLNLGDHCGDDPEDVGRNRALLAAGLPAPPVWLEQVHGTAVYEADSDRADEPAADAGKAPEDGIGRAVVAVPPRADADRKSVV